MSCTDLSTLLDAARPYFLAVVWVPLALRILRAYERYLSALQQLESPPPARPDNGSSG